ncbi:hypothetical protein GIW05_01270 [Pseudomonas syringae]|uniref:DNA-binding protein n=1 Tax=Pseudomonas syringae TaxID=317 RepID=UPI001F440900|nr:DNA-binding protein [Pseudomonas syringae]MCF5382153.1 hypothetical protein [Pseudomonas syringae]MCF5423514.1 hypothetical protein [Pseudomonas syringae]MCF5455339.1 hypothetical protein [Pseudomonas syringae]MCF5460684.1 hypothetical protein [Pseudomonas syringae]
MNTRQAPVTLADVKDAMRQLREEGEKVSVRNVQRRVGRGSFTSISKFMGAVNEGRETPELLLEALPAKLEVLCFEMATALDELAEQRTTEEREKLEAGWRNLEKTRTNLHAAKETAIHAFEAEQKTNAELRLRLAEAERKLNVSTEKLEAVTRDLGECKTQAAKSETKADQLVERLIESSSKVDQLQSYIDTYEKQVEQQRIRDEESFSTKLNGLQSALTSSQANEIKLTSELASNARQLENLRSDLRASAVRAELAETSALKQQELVAQLSVAEVESRKRENRREELLEKALGARDSLQASVTELQAQVINGHSRIEQLRTEGVAENRAVIRTLVTHAARALELARSGEEDYAEEIAEMGRAQKEIERLFPARGEGA